MEAIVQARYGGADTLGLHTIDRPEPSATQVLLEVHAAGVDRGTWHLMTGLPYLVRLAGFGIRRPKQPVPGLDVAGRVVAIGDDVTRFAVGDEVFGIGIGTFAEYAVAEEDKLAAKPSTTSFEQAAVATVSGITALEALTDVGRIEAGQSVLIVGASGGVGTFAVQLATALGGEVTGVSGPAMLDTVRALGATRVIDHTADDFVADGRRYDLVVDIGGRNSLRRLRRVLEPRGTLVIVGGEGGNRLTGGFGRSIRAAMLSPFVSQRLAMFVSTEHFSFIERLATHLEAGDVVPAIGGRYSLAQTPDALRQMENQSSRGKSVIVVRDDSAST